MSRLVVVTALLLACAPPRWPSHTPNVLDVRYRREPAASRSAGAASATRIYRALSARLLATRCRMVPSDSEAFDRRAASCGSVQAFVLGVSRLILEQGASPRYLQSVVLDGRTHWLDIPRGCSP